jgi:hypothetical protein
MWVSIGVSAEQNPETSRETTDVDDHARRADGPVSHEYGIVAVEIKSHGRYRTTAADLDALIREHLPTSLGVEQLWARADEITGGTVDYRDVTTLTEMLLIIADLSGRSI